MKTRRERRALAADMRKRAAVWPAHLTEIPESKWPPRPEEAGERPVAVWCSRTFFVQRYACPAFNGIELRRLSVNRVVIGTDGDWQENITWDDLQRCKRETGHGDWYAIEIYPRERDLVHVANMRHLWLLAEPLPIGWFEKG